MAVRHLALFVLSCLTSRVISTSPDTSAPLPDVDVASRSTNAIRIFNAVHSALRQWGSSVQHNGLSFLPVTIPEGNLFYHGTHSTQRPAGLEWLAFEMEHANMFGLSFEFHGDDNATSRGMDSVSGLSHSVSLHDRMSRVKSQTRQSSRMSHGVDGQTALLSSGDQRITAGDDDDDDDPPPCFPCMPPDARGYFHTYRAARDLKLVYIDGMGAAKCPVGTLDSQDYILLDWDIDHVPDDKMGTEALRAQGLCDLAREWKIDGWIRMEAGFEIIYCDFDEGAGLDLVSVHGSPWRNETGAIDLPVGGDWMVEGVFEWMRVAAERYHGFPHGRAQVDFSAMVSAFAYDVNITNPDESRPELPRIVNSTREERRGIKARLGEVLKARNDKETSSVDWQRVVDDIVSRYSHRLWILAEANMSVAQIRSEIATLTLPFLNFPDDAPVGEFSKPLQRCADHYLSSATRSKEQWTPEDHAIHAATKTVSHMVCQGLFELRRVIHSLTDRSDSNEDTAIQRTKSIAQELRTQLNWTTWKECGRCSDPTALCFVAMFPIGGDEDHFSPRCKHKEEMSMGYFVDRTGRIYRPDKPDKDGDAA
jgi:hypothetical protein